jgi:hypothetical protein
VGVGKGENGGVGDNWVKGEAFDMIGEVKDS